jgi:hypothetical protein
LQASLSPDFRDVYLAYGSQTMQHYPAQNVTDNQFQFDISWLYGDLKSVLRMHGEAYAEAYSRTQEGLALWIEFLSIYHHSGDKATEIAKHESIIGQIIHQFDGLFVDFINQQHKAYNSLASLGKEYDYAKRLQSICHRICSMHATYGWMVHEIETKKMPYPAATGFLRRQGIRQSTSEEAAAMHQARLAGTYQHFSDTDNADDCHGLASIFTLP